MQDKSPKERKVSKIVVSEGVVNVALTLDDEKSGRPPRGLVGGPISAPGAVPPPSANPLNGSAAARR